jgi:hypothetical protein
MKKDSHLCIPLLLLAYLTVITSCTPESCLEKTESFLEASFYSDSTKNAMAPDSLTIFGAGRDTSKIYSSKAAVRVASLPLDAQTGSSVFVIKINGITDTLSFFYYSYPHLISRECGYTYYHNIEPPAFTRHIIDSISIKNNVITPKDEENIRIYY